MLNKADQIETQQLMRVYGALMWSLGKIVNTPEVKFNSGFAPSMGVGFKDFHYFIRLKKANKCIAALNLKKMNFVCLTQVIRVYIGSFWSHPLLIPDNRKLFEAEEQDLFKDIQSLPRNAALRKLNDLIKRARLAKVRYK